MLSERVTKFQFRILTQSAHWKTPVLILQCQAPPKKNISHSKHVLFGAWEGLGGGGQHHLLACAQNERKTKKKRQDTKHSCWFPRSLFITDHKHITFHITSHCPTSAALYVWRFSSAFHKWSYFVTWGKNCKWLHKHWPFTLNASFQYFFEMVCDIHISHRMSTRKPQITAQRAQYHLYSLFNITQIHGQTVTSQYMQFKPYTDSVNWYIFWHNHIVFTSIITTLCFMVKAAIPILWGWQMLPCCINSTINYNFSLFSFLLYRLLVGLLSTNVTNR